MTASKNYRRPAILGLLFVLVLFGGGIGWATVSKIQGAVVASGSIGVRGKPKSVQHIDGGIVENITIDTGQVVSEGDTLIVLDDTIIQANFAIYRSRMTEMLLRRARLTAELDLRETLDVPEKELADFGLQDYESVQQQQQSLLNARRGTLEGQKQQIREKISQFEEQITGLKQIIESRKEQQSLFSQEENSIRQLVKRQLASNSRLLELQRARSALVGQIAQDTAEIARVRNSISEARVAIIQLDREFREKVVNELEEANSRIGELREQIQATQIQLSRVEIRAPTSGIIHELNVFTVGGVVKPGEQLMQIIPSNGELDIELHIDTRSIDQVYIDQEASIRFPAFNQQTTPELKGRVIQVSPSSVVDENSGASFFRVRVEISEDELEKLNGKQLLPGMPVEGYLTTQERTVLSYLTKPFEDGLRRAFREE